METCENAQQQCWRILLLLYIITLRFVNVNKFYLFFNKDLYYLSPDFIRIFTKISNTLPLIYAKAGKSTFIF